MDNKYLPRQGFRQLNTNKLLILKEYELSKIINENRPVKVAHGNTGESAFRNFLTKFLPKKYGVTSGFIISSVFDSLEKIPHYDVIIYDQINAPILWEDINTDQSIQGLSKAIPVEFVCGVIEIKSSLNRKAVKEGVEKLEELVKYKKVSDDSIFPSLKQNFVCGLVFFEISEKDAIVPFNINSLLPSEDLIKIGYNGGIVLKGEGLSLEESGLIVLIERKFGEIIKCNIGKNKRSLLDFGQSNSKHYNSENINVGIVWEEGGFAEFLWDLTLTLEDKPNSTLGLHSQSSFMLERRINLLNQKR